MISFRRTAAFAALSLLAMPAFATEIDLSAALHWREVGPHRGGWATTVTGVPDRPDTFYFGAAGGGVWKTENAGRTWTPLFDKVEAASIGAIAVAPSKPNILYVGTGQEAPRYDVTAGAGVFKSIDGGAHWTSLGLAATRHIGAIWVDPKNPDVLLVGAQGHFFGPNAERGIFRSTDGGKSWSHVLKINDWTGVVDIASDPKQPNVLFASAWEAHQYPWLSYFSPITGPGSAIYKSKDGGKSWQRLSGGGWPSVAVGRIGLAVADLKKGTRVYATVDSKTDGGLWRSDDGGAHWMHVNKLGAIASMYSSRLTAEPNNPDIVYTVGQSIRRCDMGGAHCMIIQGAPGGDDYHRLWINPKHPDHIITGSDQGAVVSVDGWRSWSSWYNQPTAQFYHVAADNRFPYWIYSGQQDSGTVAITSRSDYGQITFRDWHPIGGEERDYDIPDQTDPDIVYASGLGGAVTRWDAHTGQVTDITPALGENYGRRPTTTAYRFLWETVLEGSRTGTPSLYLGAQVLLRTQDRGNHWQIISPDLTGKTDGAKDCDGNPTLEAAKVCGYGVISAIEPSSRHAEEIWAGTDNGLIQLTRDGGAHWTNITPPQVPLWGNVHQISLSASEEGVAYATVDLHRLDRFMPLVLKTRDYGAHWTDISNGLPTGHFSTVVRADPVKPGLLYAGTDTSVFVSFDDGGHWQSLQSNLPTTWVSDLLVHDNDLIAGTQGRGIWILDDVSALRQIAGDTAAAPVKLFAPRTAYRVHPNNNKDTPLPPEEPAGHNPPAGATLYYWLGTQSQGPVTIEIRDAKGELVRHFSSAEKEPRLPAERYFAKAWLTPPSPLAATPGLHRFVWNLRYARPEAPQYGFGIAAIRGQGTPVLPEGAFVLPGDYTVTLTANGASQTVTLHVSEDPRIASTLAELEASMALSQQISHALGEASGLLKQEHFLKEAAEKDKSAATLNAALQTKPGAPSFAGVAGKLARVESALESADTAPTAAQQQEVGEALAELATAKQAFASVQSGPLAAYNAARRTAGKAALVIPPISQLSAPDVEEGGEDLP